MSLPHTWVLFYVHDNAELYDEERLANFFSTLAAQNCYVASELELGFLALWQQYIARPITQPQVMRSSKYRSFTRALKPGVSELLLQEIHLYSTEQKELQTLRVCSMASNDLLRGFQYSVTLAPTEGYVLLRVDQERFFGGTAARLAKYQYWLEEVIKGTYNCWRPLYVHKFDHYGVAPNPTLEEVRALNIPALYDLNIFGPELVERIGLERLLLAPAWKVETLKDQGILIVPEDLYGPTTPGRYKREEVARYLGLAPTPPNEAADAEDTPSTDPDAPHSA